MELTAISPDLRMWARVEWRSRWRSYAVLVLVIMMVVAVVLGALTAAARTDTAYVRLSEATNAADAHFFLSDAPTREFLDATRALPEVAQASFEAQLYLRPEGSEYFPDYTLLARAPWPGVPGDPLNSPLIVDGRAADPDAPHEVVLSRSFAEALGVDIGSTLAIESMTDAWVDVAYTGGDPGLPDGPVVDLTVVGIGSTTGDFGRWVGMIHLTPAFVGAYGDRMRSSAGIELDLTDDALAAALAGNPPAIAEELEGQFSAFFDESATAGALDSIATALRLVAIAAAVAGAAAVAVLIARIIAASLRHRAVLSTLGWTTRRQGRAVLLSVLPPVVLAVALGLVAGLLLSPLGLIGLAARVDPESNRVLVSDWWLLAVGLAASVTFVAMVVLAVRLALRQRTTTVPRSARGLQLHTPLPLWLGVRHALFGRAERGGRISRGAALAGVVAATAAVGALVVSTSIRLLETNPNLSGQGVGRSIDSGEATTVQDAATLRLEGDERIALLAVMDITFDVVMDGNEQSALVYDVRRGRLEPSIVAGRMAVQADEIMVGPRTLERFGISLGDVVEISSERSGTLRTAAVEVVGVMLFPEGDFEFDDGIALPRTAADRVLVDTRTGSDIHSVVYDWKPGVDAEAADAELLAEGLPVTAQISAAVPGVVRNLGEVGALPRWFAVFVGILACVSIAHAVAVSLRLRRRELNTLRALGMTGLSNASILAVHVVAISAVGMGIGVPLGLAVGAQVWRRVAEGAHVVVAVGWPWRSVVQLLIVTAGFVVLVSALAAWRTVRLRPAEDLRTG